MLQTSFSFPYPLFDSTINSTIKIQSCKILQNLIVNYINVENFEIQTLVADRSNYSYYLLFARHLLNKLVEL